MGTQFQLFVAACEIFFGEESVCSMSMRQLVITIGRNKKTFQDHISLDGLFVAKVMLAINQRFQCWLGMCERTTVSQSQVNDSMLQFDSIMEGILNGQFNMLLSPAFKKIKGTHNNKNQDNTAIGGGGQSEPEQDRRGKREICQELVGSIISNNTQC
jgi:hypothetical protein